jgi:hypothetical protein
MSVVKFSLLPLYRWVGHRTSINGFGEEIRLLSLPGYEPWKNQSLRRLQYSGS